MERTRRDTLTRLCGCCGAFLTMPLLAACESTDVASRTPGARPNMATDEAGLWSAMDRAEADLKSSPRRITDPELNAYLSGIACKVAGAHCSDIRVYPIRVPAFNAAMAPNGMMMVWTGTLLRLENEAQLAAVIAHEVAHFIQNHAVENFRRLKNTTTAAVFFSLGIGAAGGGALAMIPSLLALADTLAFSRDQEREADEIGLDLLSRAGYAPVAAAKVWENIVAERETEPEGDKTSIFASTHPNGAERQTKMKELARGKPGDFVGKEEFLVQVRRLREDLLEDEIGLRKPARTLLLLNRARQAEPEAPDLHHYLGETYRLRADSGDADRALDAYRAAVAVDPDYARPWRGIGLIERSRGDEDAARTAFARYLSLNPEATDASLLRAYISAGG